MKKINQPAGFWIRILSILIDTIIFSIISISLSLIAINKKGTKFEIIPWAYYVWMILTIIEIIILFILIPILFNGKTIGMFCTQIEIYSLTKEPMWLVVLRRNKFFSFLWIFAILVSMSFISPQLAQKMILISNKEKLVGSEELISLNTLEMALISIPTTTSSIIVFINIFMTLSMGMNKDALSINDRISLTQIVYTKKTITIFDEQNKIILKEEVKNKNIVWKE